MLKLGLAGIFNTSPLIIGIMFFSSILLVAFFIERIIYYAAYGKLPSNLWKKVINFVNQGNIRDAMSACDNSNNAFARMFHGALSKAHLSRADAEDALFVVKEEIQEDFRKHLGLFGTLSFISPLLGLLGTVFGIYQAFHDLALSGTGGPAIIAAGVSEALVATAVGIVVAVPAGVIYNYFTFRLRGLIVNMNSYGQQLILAIFERGKK